MGEYFIPKKNKKHKKLGNITANKTIPKDKKIKLTALTTVPEPYEIKWQVVNTGSEALKDLRGDFYDSDYKNVRWERSQYSGTHWVEAFVIKDDRCVARSTPFYIRIRNRII